MLRAGLRGIEENLTPPEPVKEDVYTLTQEERDRRGIQTLPGSLIEAIEITKSGELLRDVLGEHTFREFIGNKKIKWDNYRAQVTAFEITRYLPIL